MKGGPRFLKLIMLAMMVAIGVVISPIPRIEGMYPIARLIDIVYAVLLGPGYTFAYALTIGILRVTLMSIPPLVLTDAIFRAAPSGILYRLSDDKLIFTMIGEITGTGIIGALVSCPMMTLLVGKQGIGWAFYIPLFLGGMLIGGSVAFVFLSALVKTGMLASIQKRLGAKMYDKSHKSSVHDV